MTTPYPPHEHRFVVGNRGLAGIDGTVSTAVGVALGRRDASRTLALLGDVTFLHDANGLVIGPDEPRPDLTLVVVNDDGGSIFATLEQGGDPYAAAFERVFGTPHGVDLEALCRASGTAYTGVDTVAGLQAALADEPRGMRVVEARVDRSRRRATAAAITALAATQGQSNR
jgi:2-succinyl-5-enolpyruvyl-6-hydroxy-3-cyclohexene-1-carboxylate synthase